MTALIIILVLLLALGVLGVIIKGLLWLAGIALLLMVAGAVYGFVKFRGWRGSTAR